MAQTSLTPTRKPRGFDDPTKAIAAVKSRTKIGGGPAPEFLELRRQQIIEMKVRGVSNADIAAYFNVSLATIATDIQKIKKEGLIAKYEAKFLGRLLPLAIKKLTKHLEKDDGDLEGVKEVFKRFDRLSEQQHQKDLVQGVAKEETLSGWYEQWLASKQAAADAPPNNVVDADFTDADHTTVSEESVDPGRAGGPAEAGGPRAEEASAPARTDASQSGLEASPEDAAGPGGHASD